MKWCQSKQGFAEKINRVLQNEFTFAHWFPICRCIVTIILSSYSVNKWNEIITWWGCCWWDTLSVVTSSVQSPFLIPLPKWLCHRSLHCLPVRSGKDCAMSVPIYISKIKKMSNRTLMVLAWRWLENLQLPVPYEATKFFNCSSSSTVQISTAITNKCRFVKWKCSTSYGSKKHGESLLFPRDTVMKLDAEGGRPVVSPPLRRIIWTF